MARTDRGRKRMWRFRLNEGTILEVSAPEGPTEKQVRRRGRVSLILGVLIAALMVSAVAGAAVWTDKADYAPGEVVTISGDNSDGASYLAGETVVVEVSGPNGYEASCGATADETGAWSCQVTLWDSLEAVGEYTYTATGLSSSVVESGTFTDAINIGSFDTATCNTATVSFTIGTEVCAKATGLPGGMGGTGTSGKIEWLDPGNTVVQFVLFAGVTGMFTNRLTPETCGTWTLKVYEVSTLRDTSTFEVTGCGSANSAPAVTADDDSFDEGTSKTYTASWTDTDSGQTHTCTIDFGDGSGPVTGTVSPAQPSDSGTCSASHTYADGPSSYTITVNVSDGPATGNDMATATVLNLPPVITSFACPMDPYAVSTPVPLSGTYTDAGTADTHTAEIAWGDGLTTSPSASAGSVSDSHSYSAAGIHTPQLTVTDNDGDSDTETCMYVVVYDPSAGFVTGGGWIWSPQGAYVADPDMAGKATFGFVSKYKKGATVPDGNTEFQFHAAGLNFKSTSYQWLVVSGSKATYKGWGTINGGGNYGFLLSAIDGTPDKFRIKIWDKDNADAVVYDNGSGGDDANPTTELGGGSIVIHTGKK